MKHESRIVAGPVVEYDGGLRATWTAACICGWDAGRVFNRSERAGRAYAMHLRDTRRAAA